ncbi:MAG: hypothetical protein ACPGES_01445, partial [Coraliomargarita sp.]
PQEVSGNRRAAEERTQQSEAVAGGRLVRKSEGEQVYYPVKDRGHRAEHFPKDADYERYHVSRGHFSFEPLNWRLIQGDFYDLTITSYFTAPPSYPVFS